MRLILMSATPNVSWRVKAALGRNTALFFFVLIMKGLVLDGYLCIGKVILIDISQVDFRLATKCLDDSE